MPSGATLIDRAISSIGERAVHYLRAPDSSADAYPLGICQPAGGFLGGFRRRQERNTGPDAP